MSEYEVTIIGAGPGGYVAAIRCAQLGFKTALIEKYNTLGGTCLNVGCIPSKSLLDSSELYHIALKKFATHGITVSKLVVDFKKMLERKEDVVQQTCKGIDFLMKKNKISVYHGVGSIEQSNLISIKSGDGSKFQIQTKNIIIATGSKPSGIHGIEIDKKNIITSTEILKLKKIPKEMVIIGGGVIGLELGSVYARLGTKIKVIEYFEEIIPTMDRGLGKELRKILKLKLGFEFMLRHKVISAKVNKSKVTILIQDAHEKEIKLETENCLVAVGRRPYTSNLGLENLGIILDKGGQIPVNEHLETKIPGIFAIGDCIKGPMLAHKAEEEGSYVAEYLAGQKPHLNYLLIPGVVYTWPEVAAVGFTEEQLKEKNHRYKTGSFPFKASGRAKASMDGEGFVKVLADAETDEILGIHIIGPRAADLIAEGVAVMEYRAAAEDVARMCHAHPTYSEAIKEACLAATENRALHI